MTTTSNPLGPGTLMIGATGTEIDVSCNVNNARITTDKDQGESKTMLCGDVKPGSTKYTYRLTGNLDIDVYDGAASLFALSQASPGSQQPFEFIPNTDEGTAAAGTLILDPLDFGADETGTDLNSDFDWTLVDKPTYTYPVAAAAESDTEEPAA